MAQKVDRFEDLIAWQKARQLTVEIYRITAHGEFAKDFGLRDQIRRAAVSVMSNIAEGFDRASRSEFHQFLVIAKASCAEVRSQLYVALDVGYIDQKMFDNVNSSTSELSRILGGLRAAVQKQRDEK
ncbi:MAG: four helix bundle protein [Gallionella sp.]|nr:four helix bundle protein [Gallionella sp.]